jgi:hypothetical protein
MELWNEERKKLPPADEIIMTKHGESVFLNTPLEGLLSSRGIKTLLVAGLSLDGAVSTAVRMAQNLALIGNWGGKGNMEDEESSRLWTDGAGVFATALDDTNNYTVDMPRIILVEDATRTFGGAFHGGVDAQTIHNVHVESLRPLAEIRCTEDIIAALWKGNA